MKSKPSTKAIAVLPSEALPDHALLQAEVNQRLAYHLRLSLPVAAVVAGLAGIGPQAREARQ